MSSKSLRLAITLPLLVAALLVFVACGAGQDASEEQEPSADDGSRQAESTEGTAPEEEAAPAEEPPRRPED
ncbi:MAG: hypothetical protein ACRDSJ_22110, partial [Rubrobacteraceae bacterium]